VNDGKSKTSQPADARSCAQSRSTPPGALEEAGRDDAAADPAELVAILEQHDLPLSTLVSYVHFLPRGRPLTVESFARHCWQFRHDDTKLELRRIRRAAGCAHSIMRIRRSESARLWCARAGDVRRWWRGESSKKGLFKGSTLR
jgi:hypothetical protein